MAAARPVFPIKAVAWPLAESPRQQIRATDPVQLRPIPWGQRDRALGHGVCQHIADATPPTEIPCNPLIDARLRRHLRSMRIHHH